MAVLWLVLFSWYQVGKRLWRGEPLVWRRPRRRVPWNHEGALLAGAWLLLAGLGALSMHAAAANDQPAATPLISLGGALAYGVVWAVPTGLITVWLASQYKLRLRDFGAPRSAGEAARDVSLGVVAMGAALAPVYAVQYLLVWAMGLRSSHPTIEQLLNDPSLDVLAGAVLMAVVIAPLFEEFAFRVLLQGWLEKLGRRGAWWPVVASSAVFAGAHTGQGWAPAPLFVLALGLGYVYRQTHRLAPCVAMHLAFNALSLAAALAMEPASGAP